MTKLPAVQRVEIKPPRDICRLTAITVKKVTIPLPWQSRFRLSERYLPIVLSKEQMEFGYKTATEYLHSVQTVISANSQAWRSMVRWLTLRIIRQFLAPLLSHWKPITYKHSLSASTPWPLSIMMVSATRSLKSRRQARPRAK